jgi:hypothetical protein
MKKSDEEVVVFERFVVRISFFFVDGRNVLFFERFSERVDRRRHWEPEFLEGFIERFVHERVFTFVVLDACAVSTVLNVRVKYLLSVNLRVFAHTHLIRGEV